MTPDTTDTTDTTDTEGYGFEEHEVQAVLAVLIGGREGADPSWWYTELSSKYALLTEVARRVADMRAGAAYEIYQEMGEQQSYAALASALLISRGRAQQLVERGRTAPAASA